MKREELKKQLTMIKENNWEIPSEVDAYELSLEMLNNIGSVDPVLRDSLIFNMLQKVIIYKKISYEQMKEILRLCLSEEHLFYGLGKIDDDSVFNRTFTILVVGDIININNNVEKEFLNKEEVLYVYKKVMEYFEKEKDYRGYVEVKGWAHSSAHTADTLCSLAESKFIGYKELMEMLVIIKDKICIDTYAYINEEDERLINTFMSIYNRNIVQNEDIINWIYSFQNVEENGKYPNKEYLRENRKVFFRSLYFRFKKFNLENRIIEAIEQVLNNLPAFF